MGDDDKATAIPDGAARHPPQMAQAFIANFKGTYERPLIINDLRAFRQGVEESLCNFIWPFSEVRNQIPRISNDAVISSVHVGVKDTRMQEKMAVYDDLGSVDMSDKCAKAEEGRRKAPRP